MVQYGLSWAVTGRGAGQTTCEAAHICAVCGGAVVVEVRLR